MIPTKQPSKYEVIVTIIAIILGILLWYVGCQKPKPVNPVPTHTDTQHTPFYVYDTVKVPHINIPPEIIIIPGHHTVDTFIEVVVLPKDTIRIWKDSIHYQDVLVPFLLAWPENPKLIREMITKTTLKMDFIFPNDSMAVNQYPLFLDNYDYYWEENHLKAVPKKKLNYLLNPIGTDGYISGFYNPLRRSYRLELDYALRFGKVSFLARGAISTKKPFGELLIGAKYKFK